MGGSYLFHIIENYENIADRTLFLQGYQYSINLFFPFECYKGNLYSSCRNIIVKSASSSGMIELSHEFICNFPNESPLYLTFGAEFAVYKEQFQNVIRKYGQNLIALTL